MNWLWFIPILMVMVIIHEMGHFLTARLFGMKVHEFGIGFPPKAWSKKTKDGMEWSVNWLPIGGFVRIEGENGDSSHPDSFGNKPTWQRAIVLAAGPAMNLILALVIYFGITMVGGKTVEMGRPSIVDVIPGSPAATAGFLPGDIFISANGRKVDTVQDFRVETTLDRGNSIPVVMERNGKQYNTTVQPRKNPPEGEGAVGVVLGNSFGSEQLQLANSAFLNRELGLTGEKAFAEKDRIVSVDGQTFATNMDLLNYIRNIDKAVVTLIVLRGERTITNDIPISPVVEQVYKNSSAFGQKLPVGAIITKIGDTPVKTRAEYENAIKLMAGKETKLSYKLANSAQEQTIILLSNTSLESGAENRAPRVRNTAFSIIQPLNTITYNPIEAAGEAWNQTAYAVTLIPRTFIGLFSGAVPLNSLAGPIGMAQITDSVISQSADAGGIPAVARSLLILMAMLSVNLGIVNLLPLPALDGGRLVFVFIEMFTFGRRVPPDKEGLVHFAGMMLLLSSMALIAWQDILRLVSGTGF